MFIFGCNFLHPRCMYRKCWNTINTTQKNTRPFFLINFNFDFGFLAKKYLKPCLNGISKFQFFFLHLSSKFPAGVRTSQYPYIVLKKIGQRDRASWWRVCYQRGLPRLFYEERQNTWYFGHYWQLQLLWQTSTHTDGHGDSMTDRAQRAELVKSVLLKIFLNFAPFFVD